MTPQNHPLDSLKTLYFIEEVNPQTELPCIEQLRPISPSLKRLLAKALHAARCKGVGKRAGQVWKYFSPKPGDSDIGTGAEAGAADVVSPVADELQDP
jgi:hypothetical protein